MFLIFQMLSTWINVLSFFVHLSLPVSQSVVLICVRTTVFLSVVGWPNHNALLLSDSGKSVS